MIRRVFYLCKVIGLLCLCSVYLFHAALQSARIQGSVSIMRSPNSSISGNVCSCIRFAQIHKLNPSPYCSINLPVVVSIKIIFLNGLKYKCVNDLEPFPSAAEHNSLEDLNFSFGQQCPLTFTPLLCSLF